MSQETLYVDCPCCGARLEALRQNGKVVQHWAKPPKASKEGGDLLKEAAERLKAEKEKREKYLSGAKEILEQEKRKALEKFEQERRRIVEEGDNSRPPNPFDLD